MTVAPMSPPPSFGHDAEADEPSLRPLTQNEFTAVATVAALVAVLGLLGFVNSFAAVAEAARPSFGRLSWSVPLGIDLGIAIFAALDIVLARLDMRVRWLRFIPWTLTAATVYLNVAEQATPFGKVAHAVLPCLWVLAVEIGAHVVRVRAGVENGTRMDSIRPSRWLLSPLRTAALWRRMVLWEIRSYRDALGRERARLLALTELQDSYGAFKWRWSAPRRVRTLYRLGELVPVSGPDERPAIEAGPSSDESADEAPEPSRTDETPRPPKSARPKRGRSRRSSRTSAPDVSDLMPLGWRIAADLEAKGEALTRDTLAAQLRDAGRAAGNARVGALLTRLKTETPDATSTPTTQEEAA
ncbi:DUF2637 domain-containing protein [Actinomadura rupiterrae]|uniref:DUF2637 domain-containing protein n=1 Tax=Actinomadura rupiterrae TaxID=559627 RepID=UPI0020A4A36C|nr:DUF2637 domain-containing protein [Actinomadura rupiterrae]MCP2340466.1 hypothetical protein [Actinomadura rupiterrae]